MAEQDWEYKVTNEILWWAHEVGDDIRDCQAAAAAGCGMIFLADATVGHDLPASRHHQSVHESFMGALEVIRSYYDGRSDS